VNSIRPEGPSFVDEAVEFRVGFGGADIFPEGFHLGMAKSRVEGGHDIGERLRGRYAESLDGDFSYAHDYSFNIR
jgi:hypothetical protein